MVQTARTLVKSARFDSLLELCIRKLPHPVHRIGLGVGNVCKYLVYDSGQNPFILIAAQQKDINVTTPQGYNLTLSVTSYADAQNQELAEQFSRETGVEFNVKPPTSLVALISQTDKIFP